jgi:hypothetical protein
MVNQRRIKEVSCAPYTEREREREICEKKISCTGILLSASEYIKLFFVCVRNMIENG